MRARGLLLLVASVFVGGACTRTAPEREAPENTEEVARAREIRQTPAAELAAPPPSPRGPPLVGDQGQDRDGYPNQYVDRLVLRSLLREERYAELTQHIEALQTAFEGNPRFEYWPIDAGDAFASAEPELTSSLEAWAKAMPDSFAPHLALAAHWTSVAYARRGARAAKNTHADDFRAMDEAGQKALGAAERALEINPKLVAAHRLQIQVLMTSSEHKRIAAVVKSAVRVCPECFQVRVTHLVSLRPRWSGTHERMLEAARSTPVDQNPRLRLLPGYVHEDRADVFRRKKDHRAALEEIQLACALGDHWEFLKNRAKIHRALEDLESAARDLARAAALRPGLPSIVFDRAEIAFERREYEAAGRELLAGLLAEPTNAGGRRLLSGVVQGLIRRAWEYQQAGRGEDALRLFELALQLDPTHRDARQRRDALVSGSGGSTPEGTRALAEAATASPNDFRAHQALDYALAKEGKLDQVIEMWDDYLSRNPDDGRAYLERGGAHWRLRHLAEAHADASKACELGVSEGCMRAKQTAPR